MKRKNCCPSTKIIKKDSNSNFLNKWTWREILFVIIILGISTTYLSVLYHTVTKDRYVWEVTVGNTVYHEVQIQGTGGFFGDNTGLKISFKNGEIMFIKPPYSYKKIK